MFTLAPCTIARMARIANPFTVTQMVRGSIVASPSLSVVTPASLTQITRITSTSPNEWRRHFHLTASSNAMIKMRMNLNPYFSEVGMIAEPEVPPPVTASSLLTLAGWKGVVGFGQRKVRNFYLKRKVRKEGKNMTGIFGDFLSDFSLFLKRLPSTQTSPIPCFVKSSRPPSLHTIRLEFFFMTFTLPTLIFSARVCVCFVR